MLSPPAARTEAQNKSKWKQTDVAEAARPAAKEAASSLGTHIAQSGTVSVDGAESPLFSRLFGHAIQAKAQPATGVQTIRKRQEKEV